MADGPSQNTRGKNRQSVSSAPNSCIQDPFVTPQKPVQKKGK